MQGEESPFWSWSLPFVSRLVRITGLRRSGLQSDFSVFSSLISISLASSACFVWPSRSNPTRGFWAETSKSQNGTCGHSVCAYGLSALWPVVARVLIRIAFCFSNSMWRLCLSQNILKMLVDRNFVNQILLTSLRLHSLRDTTGEFFCKSSNPPRFRNQSVWYAVSPEEGGVHAY